MNVDVIKDPTAAHSILPSLPFSSLFENDEENYVDKDDSDDDYTNDTIKCPINLH